MDYDTRRYVKNVLHNELGVTSEKVEKMMCDYIDKKLEAKFDDFMNSSTFGSKVNRYISNNLKPFISEAVKKEFSYGMTINVNLNEKQKD